MKTTLLALSTLLMCASANAASDVRLEDRGELVILDNGILTATINKFRASVDSLKVKGAEMVSQSGRGPNVYFSMDGGANYRQPKGCLFSVKTQSPEMVDIACRRVWKDEPQAFDIETHYVLRRGDSGLYAYVILDHPAKYPATRYGEWRMVWRTPQEAEAWICVDEQRHWRMPDPADYKTALKTGIKEIMKLTQGVRAGQFDCKYDFKASYPDIPLLGPCVCEDQAGRVDRLRRLRFLQRRPDEA